MPDITATPATVIADQRSNLVPRQFACAFAIATVAVLLAGWFSGVRETANVAMGSVLSVAFLPFVIIAIGVVFVFLAIAVAILGALLGGDGAAAEGAGAGADIAAMGAQVLPGYYRWLFSIRHPFFWGAFAGVFFGALLLFGLIALIITPGERQTAQILRVSQGKIDQAYADTGDYPAPTASGGLVLDGVAVNDGFGRPLSYMVTGKWKMKSYTLSSLGYDGFASEDDMSISGAMDLAKAMDRVKKTYQSLKGGIDGLKDAYNAINEMKKNKPQQ